MSDAISRRGFLSIAPAAAAAWPSWLALGQPGNVSESAARAAAGATNDGGKAMAGGSSADGGAVRAIPPEFPQQPRELVQAIVGASHRDLKRVQELLRDRPSLANAAYDWGFGDWETALGAASHTGRREIAELLLANGARPDIFSAAMLGQLEVVQAFVAAAPGIQRLRGPHGIPLLAHAEAGGAPAAKVVAYLESLGDAGRRYAVEPLSDEQRQRYVGVYSFGAAADERLTVKVGSLGLALQRDAGTSRALLFLGDHEFHPAGAPAVRIKFDAADGRPAAGVTVRDADVVVTAKRV